MVLVNRLRVVPLFETVKDLREAGPAIRKLLAIDWYREHVIKNHKGHQEVECRYRRQHSISTSYQKLE